MSGLEHALTIAAHALIWAVALVAWAFVARYTLHTWWRIPEGRHLMTFTAVFALLFTLTGLGPWLNIPLVAWLAVQNAALLLALGVISWRHALLTTSDKEG